MLGMQMQQSVKILQMSSAQLEKYLQELALENPVFEADIGAQPPPREIERFVKRTPRSASEESMQPDIYRPQRNTLRAQLQTQLGELRVDKKLRALAKYLIDDMDEAGYIIQSDEALAAQTGAGAEAVDRARALIQTMEPAGVGARTLAECLLLQLERMDGDYGLEKRLVREKLEALAAGRSDKIAKALGVTRARLNQALAIIRALNPKPGNGFMSEDETVYIRPDVYVIQNGDELEVVSADTYVSSLRLDPYYCALADTEDEALCQYLREKLREAKWVCKCVRQRGETMLECARMIAKRQKAFFLYGAERRVPLLLTDIADALGLSIPTVSRAVRGKYLWCKWGIIPFSSFFSRGVGGVGGDTRETICMHMSRLIAKEDKQKPFSDMRLSELLMIEYGTDVSRRTVAKYREELGIPSSQNRKR
jgi:RNA polymerase sigma-54 factor